MDFLLFNSENFVFSPVNCYLNHIQMPKWGRRYPSLLKKTRARRHRYRDVTFYSEPVNLLFSCCLHLEVIHSFNHMRSYDGAKLLHGQLQLLKAGGRWCGEAGRLVMPVIKSMICH